MHVSASTPRPTKTLIASLTLAIAFAVISPACRNAAPSVGNGLKGTETRDSASSSQFVLMDEPT